MDKLYIIISDPEGEENPVVLSLDWESEKPSRGSFCTTWDKRCARSIAG